MGLPAKKKFAVSVVLLSTLLATALCVLGFILLGDIDINIPSNGNSFEAQEASRKLKLLGEAQASKKQGFIRLSEAEINGFLQSRYGKPEKNRTNELVRLVKAGVQLHQSDLTFITWHKVSLLGLETTVVWQRLVSPQRTANGWRLSLDEMRVGKATIPGTFWGDAFQILGGSDKTFEERKVWLASMPTVMLSHNEITRAPELRLYTYIPVIKSEEPSSEPEGVSTSSKSSTNTLAATLAR